VDRDDDLRIGMKTSAITLGSWDVVAVTSFYVVQLLIWTVLLVERIAPWAWFLALVAAVTQVVWHHRLIRERTREGCFRAFRVNHWFGFTLFAGIVSGYTLK
jgi:4-hydroxybenzoate polyprenyltransferase